MRHFVLCHNLLDIITPIEANLHRLVSTLLVASRLLIRDKSVHAIDYFYKNYKAQDIAHNPVEFKVIVILFYIVSF